MKRLLPLLAAAFGIAQFITPVLAEEHLVSMAQSDWQSWQAQFRMSAEQPQKIAAQQDTVLLRLNDQQLQDLSHFMHEQQHRCGGFFAYENLATAMQAMRPVEQPILPLATYTIDQQSVVSPLLSQVSESRLRQMITDLSAFQNRYYNASYGKSSSEWIRDQWTQIASTRSDISVELKSCSTCGIQQNVILTIPGSTLPNEIVVLGAHADSIIGGMTTNSRAPGADDDASGVSVITEVLRVAVANNFRPQRTVQFMAYAAEEVGLRGSQAIANEYQSQSKNVYAVVQFDMTNYAGTGADVWIMTDNGNSTLIQFLRDLFDTYLAPSGLTRGNTSCGYGCSDHASWNRAGFPAAMYAETTFNQTNPNLHTVNDTLSAMGGTANHSIAFAKLGVAFAYETGKTGTTPPPPPPPPGELRNDVPVTGLSGSQGQELRFYMNVPAGARNLAFDMSGGSGDADMYVRFGSEPTTSSYDCRPYRNGNVENCSFATPQTGRYYVMLRGYSSFSGVTLKGAYQDEIGGDSFENTNNYNIPDNNSTGVQSPLSVTGSGNAGTISVEVAIVHTYIGDLIVDVIAPDGTVYNVHNRSGGSADNINQTYSVNVGSKPRSGTWNLRVRDLARVDTGYIDRWKITFP